MKMKKDQYVLYKGLPLVRDGDLICYGDLNEKYILTLNILGKDTKDSPNMIMVQICHSDDRNKIVKGKQAFKRIYMRLLTLVAFGLSKSLKKANKRKRDIPSGYISSFLFIKIIYHFINNIKCNFFFLVAYVLKRNLIYICHDLINF